MKIHPKPQLLPAIAVGMGTAAMLLRFCVYALTTDEKGLLLSGHPLQWLLWAAVAAAAAVILVALRPFGGSGRYEDNFPASSAGAAGCLAMAVGIGITVFKYGMGIDRVEKLCFVSGILAAACLMVMGFHRLKGRPFGFGFPALVCLYLSAYTICFYPMWSSKPQFMDTLFILLGCVGLMVFSYQLTAFSVGLGKRRMTLGTGLLSVVACMTAIPENEDFPLFLCGALWALTNLCCPVPPEAHPDRKE